MLTAEQLAIINAKNVVTLPSSIIYIGYIREDYGDISYYIDTTNGQVICHYVDLRDEKY